MTQSIDIGTMNVALRWNSAEQCLSIISPGFINERDATLYFPKGLKTLPPSFTQLVQGFVSGYPQMKARALVAIGQKALAGGFWGKRLSEHPQMDLVWARFSSPDKPLFELAYNDAEHDAYTLWVAEFHGLELQSVDRIAW